jgi:uncharacterized protein YciI
MTEPDIQTIPYFLVLLTRSKGLAEAEEHFAAHVEFIGEMSAANIVLLGGDLDPSVDGAEGAYLLHTASQAEAEGWAARDPLVSSGAYAARVVAWHLVGIAPSAIDPRLLEI